MSEWTDLGEKLKATRDKRGLSLDDISHQSRIPMGTLEALENNDYSRFSSPTYAKSFLGQYADFLNIDAHDWLDCFETGNVLTHSENMDYLVKDDPEPKNQTKPRSPRPPRRKKQQESSGRFGQTVFIFLITGGLIAGAVWGFLKLEEQIIASDPEALEAKETSDLAVASNLETTPSDSPSPTIPTVTGTPGNPLSAALVPPNPGEITPPGIEEPLLEEPLLEEPEDTTPPPRAILVDED